ncbi:MAG: MBOAT family O-acyltransferase [Bacteroidota bacterium]
MLFTSVTFAIFFPLIFFFYWFIAGRNRIMQNLFLLLASYVFYGWWNWKFLLLLFSLSVVNYTLALTIQGCNHRSSKKFWFLSGLIINTGVLVYFKYINFFIDSIADVLSLMGVKIHLPAASIMLPLGLSFYIFLSISYIIDVYREKMKADKNFIEVLLSFSFFPIILAGPIQRPFSLLPQIHNLRQFDYTLAVEGLRRILLGLFMKIVIADQCAVFVNEIFKNPGAQTPSTLLFGGIYYAIQIYADFAGYSEIAIGVAALLGFKLMRNFAYPYFAKDIADFWKRWHISLTGWFRDYIFLPVAYATSGRFVKDKVGFIKTDLVIYVIAITVTWLLTGLWHGGNMTFIAWGLIHGAALILHQTLKNPKKKLFKRWNLKYNNFFIVSFNRVFTLCIVFIAWIFFRAESIDQAISYLKGICHPAVFSFPQVVTPESVIIIIVFFLTEWFQRNKAYTLQPGERRIPFWVRWVAYYVIFISLFVFSHKEQVFIYLQF